MHSFDATFRQLLVKAIEQETDRLRSVICEKPLDREIYLQFVGRLDGYRMVLQLAEDVEHRLSQGTP